MVLLALMLPVLLAASLLGGCAARPDPDPSPSPSEAMSESATTEVLDPCPGGGVDHQLGSPYRGQEHARFTTVGGRIWVTARHFPEGGMFDPETGRTRILVGPADTPPVYDAQRGRVDAATAETSVVEGTWSALDLPAGEHWLWSTTGGDVVLRTCAADVITDTVPAPG